MSSQTNNLQLYKADPLTDGNKTFNINTMLNENWDKVDENVGELSDKIGILSNLTTTEKSNLVGAITEVNESVSTHKNKTISGCVYASRDLSIIGDQTITIPFLPKSIIVFANAVNAAYKYSDGIWSENITAGYCRYSVGNLYANAYNGSLGGIAQIVDSADNYTIATVKSVSATELVLTWAKTGTGATGTCDLFIQLGTH